MELWDAYTREGEKTGEILVRGEPIPEGRYHLVCEVLVRHMDGDYLCMIRSGEKPNYPRYPECSAGGSALLGETPLACISRELREETGIEWENFEQIGYAVRELSSSLFYSYAAVVDWPKDRIALQEGETEDYKWLSEEQFIELLNSGRMIPEQLERLEAWFRKMGYLR